MKLSNLTINLPISRKSSFIIVLLLAVTVISLLLLSKNLYQAPLTDIDSTSKQENIEPEAVTKPEIVPPKPKTKEEINPPINAKGIYVTGNIAGLPSRFNKLINLLNETELNAMVIDIKDDNGLLTYESSIPMAVQTNANKSVRIKDIKSLLNTLKENDIYPIARIVTFKDPSLAKQLPDLAIQHKDGGLYQNKKNTFWSNPYDKRVWDYNIALAKEAAELGFREIQFDYVRFPENAKKVDALAVYPVKDERNKAEVISEFLEYARKELEPYNVWVAADIFGLVATAKDDLGIGQQWEKVVTSVDYVCLMAYPSHYGPGVYGFSNPNAHPYEVVQKTITDGNERMIQLEKHAKHRPWIQDFDLGKPAYGVEELQAQIKALKDLGIEDYLLWNPNNRYTEAAFRK